MNDPSLPNLHGDDPRPLGGDIAGPGGPHDLHAVVVDCTDAVLLDHTTVSIVHLGRRDQPGEVEHAVGLLLEGRVNKSRDRTRVLYLVNADGAAALLTELVGLASRARADGLNDLADEFVRRCGDRWDDMPK
jgi:hypothetical protein